MQPVDPLSIKSADRLAADSAVIPFAVLVNSGGQTSDEARRCKGLWWVRVNPLPLSPPNQAAVSERACDPVWLVQTFS